MASIQETLRSALGADATLTALVGDRIYPGQIPDNEATIPWLFYAVPTSDPVDDLDGGAIDVISEVEFHALGDKYSDAKSIIDAVVNVLKTYSGGAIKQALWAGSTEDSTEDGYHHATRFRIVWVLS